MSRIRVCTDAPEYNDHPILTDRDRGLRCDEKILNTEDGVFNHFFDNHDRGFFMRYDLRLPEDDYSHTSNEAFRAFQANFAKNLSRQGLDPHYMVVREQSREKHQHYHGFLLLDGRKTQSIRGHIAKADELWANALGIPGSKGLVDDCTKDRNGNKQENGVMLRKDDPDYQRKLDGCMCRASYLAKINQKQSVPRKIRELFSTRIPKANGQDNRHGGDQLRADDEQS